MENNSRKIKDLDKIRLKAINNPNIGIEILDDTPWWRSIYQSRTITYDGIRIDFNNERVPDYTTIFLKFEDYGRTWRYKIV